MTTNMTATHQPWCRSVRPDEFAPGQRGCTCAAPCVPGAMIDGTRIGIPDYRAIRHLSEITSDRTRRIAAVDGGRRARARLAALNRHAKALAKIAGEHGCYVSYHDVTYDLTWRRYRVTAWVTYGQTIRHAIELTDNGWYRFEGEAAWHLRQPRSPLRSWWQALEAGRDARRAERAASRQARAAAYLQTLSETARALQAQARIECLTVSADGSTVTEHLHDCGGAITSAAPSDLAELQARHDAIYHAHEAAMDAACAVR